MWIELHDSAREHPKTLKLAKRLSIKPVHALGHMASLWCWSLRMAPDGDLGSFDAEDIAIGAQWDDDAELFIAALVAVRLLDRTVHGLVVHDWGEFAGSLKTAERVRTHREKKRGEKKEETQNVTLQGVTVTLGNADRPNDRPTGTNDRPERPNDVAPSHVTVTGEVVSLDPADEVITAGDVIALMQHWAGWPKHTGRSDKGERLAVELAQQRPFTRAEIVRARTLVETVPGPPSFGLLMRKVQHLRQDEHKPQQTRLISKQDQSMAIAFANVEAFNATRR